MSLKKCRLSVITPSPPRPISLTTNRPSTRLLQFRHPAWWLPSIWLPPNWMWNRKAISLCSFLLLILPPRWWEYWWVADVIYACRKGDARAQSFRIHTTHNCKGRMMGSDILVCWTEIVLHIIFQKGSQMLYMVSLHHVRPFAVVFVVSSGIDSNKQWNNWSIAGKLQDSD